MQGMWHWWGKAKDWKIQKKEIYVIKLLVYFLNVCSARHYFCSESSTAVITGIKYLCLLEAYWVITLRARRRLKYFNTLSHLTFLIIL